MEQNARVLLLLWISALGRRLPRPNLRAAAALIMHRKSHASCSNFSLQYSVNSQSLSLWALLHPLLYAPQRLLTHIPHPCWSCGHAFVPHPINPLEMLCPKELCPFQPSWHGLCALKQSLELQIPSGCSSSSSGSPSVAPSPDPSPAGQTNSSGSVPAQEFSHSKTRSSTFNDLSSLWACRVSLHPVGHKTTKAIPKGSFHPHKNVHTGSPGCFKLCVKSGVVTSCRVFFSFWAVLCAFTPVF